MGHRRNSKRCTAVTGKPERKARPCLKKQGPDMFQTQGKPQTHKCSAHSRTWSRTRLTCSQPVGEKTLAKSYRQEDALRHRMDRQTADGHHTQNKTSIRNTHFSPRRAEGFPPRSQTPQGVTGRPGTVWEPSPLHLLEMCLGTAQGWSPNARLKTCRLFGRRCPGL